METESWGEQKIEIIVRIKRRARDKLGDIRDQGDKAWEEKDVIDKVWMDKTEMEVGKGMSERGVLKGGCFLERVS